jgi:hypothetical protein
MKKLLFGLTLLINTNAIPAVHTASAVLTDDTQNEDPLTAPAREALVNLMQYCYQQYLTEIAAPVSIDEQTASTQKEHTKKLYEIAESCEEILKAKKLTPTQKSTVDQFIHRSKTSEKN